MEFWDVLDSDGNKKIEKGEFTDTFPYIGDLFNII